MGAARRGRTHWRRRYICIPPRSGSRQLDLGSGEGTDAVEWETLPTKHLPMLSEPGLLADSLNRLLAALYILARATDSRLMPQRLHRMQRGRRSSQSCPRRDTRAVLNKLSTSTSDGTVAFFSCMLLTNSNTHAADRHPEQIGRGRNDCDLSGAAVLKLSYHFLIHRDAYFRIHRCGRFAPAVSSFVRRSEPSGVRPDRITRRSL